ncbi:30913_t:CDS:1, partial [Racocetra persica]
MIQNSFIDSSKKNPNDKQPIPDNNRIKNTASCNFCRQKKVKCNYLNDGRCRQCINHNIECKSDPQKKRGPKGPEKETGSNTPSRVRTNLFENGSTLRSLIQNLSNSNLFENSLTDNERTLLNLVQALLNLILTRNLNRNSSNHDEIHLVEVLSRTLMTNEQTRNLVENSSGINNMRLNNDPMLTDSTQESLQSRTWVENSSVINNKQMLSSINNEQMFLPSEEDRQRKRKTINYEPDVELHRNVSNTNALRSPSTSYTVSMHSDNEQQNLSDLQFPETTLQNFADISLTELNNQIYYSPIFGGTSDNSSDPSPLITADSQPMPMLGDTSPPITADSQAMPMQLSGGASPPTTADSRAMSPSPFTITNLVTDPLATPMPFLKLVSPMINSSTDPQT